MTLSGLPAREDSLDDLPGRRCCSCADSPSVLLPLSHSRPVYGLGTGQARGRFNGDLQLELQFLELLVISGKTKRRVP